MMKKIELFTIGFTEKNAEKFFSLLKNSGVKKVVDVRISNTSQLAGFARKDDLPFFLNTIGNIGYEHVLEFAPELEMMKAYRNKKFSWNEYEKKYLALMKKRNVDKIFPADYYDGSCFLCSEHEPEFCHRRVLAEFLKMEIPGIEIIHLM